MARARAPAAGLESGGFKSMRLGVAAYADWLNEPQSKSNAAPVSSVTVFREGYFSEDQMREAYEQVKACVRSIGIEPEPDE